jgi:hypothetical protein
LSPGKEGGTSFQEIQFILGLEVGWNEKPVFFVLSGKHEAALASNRLGRRGTLTTEFPMKTAVNEYRAKAYECLSLAECMNDPEERAEVLRFARMWFDLAEPIEEFQGVYEVPRGR